MEKRFGWKKAVLLLVIMVFCVQTAGCGYFIYPERRGRTQGKVDPAVAIMDGACLLLFIIPGIIAFAVDFSSGAIYMSGGAAKKAGMEKAGPKIVQTGIKGLDNSRLEAAILNETGIRVDLSKAEVRTLDKASSDQQIMAATELAAGIGFAEQR